MGDGCEALRPHLFRDSGLARCVNTLLVLVLVLVLVRLLRIRLVILLRLATVLVVCTITPAIMLVVLPFWLELPLSSSLQRINPTHPHR